MSTPYIIERLHTTQPGETFNLPDGWIFYSYKCKDDATVTITNALGESLTDDDSGSSFNQSPGGFKGMTFQAQGGQVLIKWY